MSKNQAAVALGKMAKGRKKNYSPDERLRRAIWAKEMTRKRMAKKKESENLSANTGESAPVGK